MGNSLLLIFSGRLLRQLKPAVPCARHYGCSASLAETPAFRPGKFVWDGSLLKTAKRGLPAFAFGHYLFMIIKSVWAAILLSLFLSACGETVKKPVPISSTTVVNQLRPLYKDGQKPVTLDQVETKLGSLRGPEKISSLTQPSKDSLLFCQNINKQANCFLVLMPEGRQVLIVADNAKQASMSARANLALLRAEEKKQKIIKQGPR